MWLYNFSDLPPMVKTGVWIPLTGSFLLEQSVGIARALSIYVEGGYLKLHQQQTVGPAPGGWGPHSHNYGEPGQFHSGTLESMFPTHAQGGETLYYDGPAGWPLWYGGDTAPYRVVATYTAGGGYFTAEGDGYFRGISAGHFSWPGYQRLSQTLFAVTRGTTTDPTNMGSTWQVEIVGKFGRRS
jgi:hypothetical protein